MSISPLKVGCKLCNGNGSLENSHYTVLNYHDQMKNLPTSIYLR